MQRYISRLVLSTVAIVYVSAGCGSTPSGPSRPSPLVLPPGTHASGRIADVQTARDIINWNSRYSGRPFIVRAITSRRASRIEPMRLSTDPYRRLLLASVLLTIGGGRDALAQLPARTPPADAATRFRVAIEQVEIDATVVDRRGQFVRGLDTNDFEILEDGQPQRLSTLTGEVGRSLPPPSDPLIEPVLTRLAAYLADYSQQFANVVAEEDYQQRVEISSKDWMGERRLRRLRSDLLLVRVPGPDTWMPFRDVFEVDGRRVRDRDERLQKLFLEWPATALQDARRLADEGARFNIGPVYRNFNLPTLPLMFFTPERMTGFSFQRRGEESIEGARTWRIDYQEVRRPTVMGVLAENQRDSKGDMPASGSLWIDPLTGRVLQTRVHVDVGGYQFDSTVTYRRSETLGIWVPFEMRELYRGGGPDIYGRAVYKDFRLFLVTTDEKFGPPKREE
jgi:hypothetical protein